MITTLSRPVTTQIGASDHLPSAAHLVSAPT